MVRLSAGVLALQPDDGWRSPNDGNEEQPAGPAGCSVIRRRVGYPTAAASRPLVPASAVDDSSAAGSAGSS